MNLQKLNWKLFFKNPEAVKPHDFFKVFNQWIPDSPEIFIDVADYEHVQDGPITFLAGYHADYVLDHTDHKYGLMMNQKTPLEGTNEEKVASTLKSFLKRAAQLVQNPLLKGLNFDLSQIQLVINDRALVPNEATSQKALVPLLEKALKPLVGDGLTFTRDENPRVRFNLTVKAAKPFIL